MSRYDIARLQTHQGEECRGEREAFIADSDWRLHGCQHGGGNLGGHGPPSARIRSDRSGRDPAIELGASRPGDQPTETNWTITGNWKVSFPNGLNPDDYLNDTAAPAFATWAGAGPLSNQTRIRELKLFPCVSPQVKASQRLPTRREAPAC